MGRFRHLAPYLHFRPYGPRDFQSQDRFMNVDTLNAALSGLRAAQSQMGLISTNIANATTPGYTRKILPQGDFVVSGQSIGVTTGQVRRSVNTTLQFDLYKQTSLASISQIQLKYLSEIQLFHGDPNDQRALPGMMQGLSNDFRALADSPTDGNLLAATVNHARQFALRVNELSALYTRQRNDVQAEMSESVNTINRLLQQIATANEGVVRNANIGQSTAAQEDQRDQAVLELSQELDISYFKNADGRLVVQTEDGEALVDYTARTLVFEPTTLGVNSTYPGSAAGIFIDNPNSVDVEITTRNLGGKLQGLLGLRDDTLPRYQAELDEMTQKLAERFDAQGVRLFTGESGTVPPSVAPPTATGYAGFAQEFQVNSAIISNPQLLRLGTDGETIPASSARIIDRIVKYTFGLTQAETASGNVDISAATDLFTLLSIDSLAKVNGLKDIAALGALDSSSDINPGTEDTFSIAIGAGLPVNIVIAPGDTAADLVNTINTAFPGLASLSATGRLVLQDDENITIAAGTLGADGLEALGLSAGVTNAQNPSFTVQLDDGLSTTVSINSADTSTQLLAQLNAISGVNAALDVNGFLQITTDYGADIKLTDSVGGPLAALGVMIAPVVHGGFRTANLGPGADINSAVTGADTLISYTQRLISTQAAAASGIESDYNANETYRATVEQQYTNENGVNLDEEMANLIAVQRVYGANAKMLSTSIRMLEELMNAI